MSIKLIAIVTALALGTSGLVLFFQRDDMPLTNARMEKDPEGFKRFKKEYLGIKDH